MNAKLIATKNELKRHKVIIAVTATAAICFAVNRMSIKQHNEFLKEHDLYNEFYAPEA
jgi:hypothetical protein